MFNRFWLSFIVVVSLVFVSCQDDPTSLGQDLIDNPVDIVVLNSVEDSISQNSGSYRIDSTVNYFRSTNRLIGRLDNMSSVALIRFSFLSLPDTIVTAFNDGNLKIVSSSVEMPVVYEINKNGNFDFNLYEITSSWSPVNFDADSLSMITYDETRDMSSNRVITDSLITFDIDTSIINDLFKVFADTNAFHHGLIIDPTSSTNKVFGFDSYFGSTTASTPLLRVIVEDEGNYIDTLNAIPLLNSHVVQGTFPEAPQDEILLQGGLFGRGQLFFDLSKLPANININKAELTLAIDSVNSILGSPAADSIKINLFADSSAYEYNPDISLSRIKKVDFTYVGDISRIVQEIALGAENQGFGLRISNELGGTDRIYIYGSSYSDTALRPKLTIYYSRIGL